MISGRIYVTESQIICGSRDGTANVLYPVSSGESIPSGIITMWSGASNAIPEGWFLCDGNNNTPDLRNRFIVGAGSSYAVGNTGGADTVTLTSSNIPAHFHNVNLTTASSGSHTHSHNFSVKLNNLKCSSGGEHTHYIGVGTDSTFYGYLAGSARSNDSMNLTGGSHTHTITGSGSLSGSISSGGAHTHSISGNTSSVGNGSSHENRPPYYALCFIMKA